MSVIINCRDNIQLTLPLNEIRLMDDFFLKNMIIDCSDDNQSIQLYEDGIIVQHVIDSIRLKKLIYSDENQLSYMLAICEKWCVPQWLIDSINNKQNKDLISKMTYNYDMLLTCGVKKCINCSAGFKPSENTNVSCKTHRCSFDNNLNLYHCCGETERNKKFCRIGYHIPEHPPLSYHDYFLKNIKDIIKFIN